MSQVVNGKTAIEARLAWKLAAVLGTTPEFWLNLQNAIDLWEAHQLLADWQPETTYPARTEVQASDQSMLLKKDARQERSPSVSA
jgi:antitoxin HigA-1